jgi:hypothetical protein
MRGGARLARSQADCASARVDVRTKNIKFDHQFLGREALETEAANPNERYVLWSETPKTLSMSMHASCSGNDRQSYRFLDTPRDRRSLMSADKMDGNGISTTRGYGLSVHSPRLRPVEVNAAPQSNSDVRYGRNQLLFPHWAGSRSFRRGHCPVANWTAAFRYVSTALRWQEET